ncbi:DUF4124 domain-containing protein [Candidatus Berkiella aquae]|uniref:DUF4124 domain-containing protein n=1 Tax=Candidatus Berkiella aquae TaxID=295108 RepID=A0A0Q9YK76_9GAMM|nr:DUF4124 domain-containing protein [Candidatus Berkiella aquae]MCS5710054.1 DUF4124 domain-containing protein [Candidatus Berkiella aquae]
MKASTWVKILFIISHTSMTCAFAQDNYYRYKDKEGNVVISNSVPADFANSGYEVISPTGNVIETVLPRKTDEEIAADAKAAQDQREAQKQVELKNQQEQAQAHKDNILLKSFASVADINRARDDKLASIAVLENIIKENLGGLEKQLKDAQAAALTYQQKSQALPESLQKTIAESERQIKDGQAFLERKKAEKLEIIEKYKLLAEHFTELQTTKTGSQTAPNSASEPSPNAAPSTTPLEKQSF